LITEKDLLIAGGRGPTVLISTIDGRHRKISSNLEAILKEQRYVSVLDGVDHSARMGARDLYFDAASGALYLSYVVRSEAGEDCFGLGILRAEILGDLWDSDFGIQWAPFWATEACVQNSNTHAAGGRMQKYREGLLVTIGDFNQHKTGNSSLLTGERTEFGKTFQIQETAPRRCFRGGSATRRVYS